MSRAATRRPARRARKTPCGCASNPDDELPIGPAQVTPGEPADLSTCLQWVRLEKVPNEYAACMDQLGQFGKITTAKDVFEALRGWYEKQDQEVCVILLVDVQLNVRGVAEVSRGERDSAVIPIPDILRVALVDGATGVILCHNHPTGSSTPSDDDKTSTVALAQACETVGLMLMDHVIIGRDEHFSFADSGLLSSPLVVPEDGAEHDLAPVLPEDERQPEQPFIDEALVEDRHSGARRGWEHRRERDEFVVQNLDPSLIPLWERIKGQFVGTPEERYEEFMQYVHEHPGEEAVVLQSSADAWLDAEIRAGRARENSRRTIRPEMRPIEHGLRGVGQRMAQAEENFIEILMRMGNISKADAEKVYQTYRKLKVIKSDAVNGVINVKHGGFLDRETIRRALAQAPAVRENPRHFVTRARPAPPRPRLGHGY